MRYVVGYTATPQGTEAIQLASSLARTFNAELDIVVVLRRHSAFRIEYPPTGNTDNIILKQAYGWLEGALAMVPEDVQAQGHLYADASTAEGLIHAAKTLGAGAIIVGGASDSPIKRHRLGTVANDLLYSCPLPVALAPRGYQARPIERLNCAVGTRPGSGSLVREGIISAQNSGLPLRLVALVESANGSPAAEEARANTQRILDCVRQELAPEDGGIGEVEIAVGQTDDVAGALDYVGFEESDLMMVGSSRVAQKHSIFVGSAAMHILRTLTIPLVVVPRDYRLARRDAGDGQRA